MAGEGRITIIFDKTRSDLINLIYESVKRRERAGECGYMTDYG
jgi:hypothetical protein